MRRLYAATIAVLVLTLLPLPASAFMLGHPILETGKYTVSGEYFTMDTDLERKGNANDHWKLDSSLFLGRITYTLAPNGELFFIAGMNNTNFEDQQDVATIGGSMNGSNEYCMGVGVRGSFYEGRRVEVMGMLQVLSGTNINGTFNRQDGTSFSASFDVLDIQAAVTVVYPMGNFRPYAGIQYEPLTVGANGLPGVSDLEIEKPFGLVAGTQFQFNRNWKLDVEGQFLGQTNVGASVSYIFW